MTVFRIKDSKRKIYVSKENFWESMLSDMFMAGVNIFTLWLARNYFGNEWLPCLMLWIIFIALCTRFQEKQVSKDEFIEIIEKESKGA